jgi:hypothetical protein
MHEDVLKSFFLGRLQVAVLSSDLDGSIVASGPDEASVVIHDEVGEFTVTAQHLLRVCDAVIAGRLEPWKLEAIGFCIVASDFFTFDRSTPDGERVAEVIHKWAAPQVNYPLTLNNAAKFRELLLTGDDPFTAADCAERADVEWNVGRVSKRFAGREQ